MKTTSTTNLYWDLIFPLFVGLLSWGLWWYELHYLMKWQSYAWLGHPLYSVFIITFLVVVSFLLPIFLEFKVRWYWQLLYLVLLYIVGLTAYFTSKQLFLNLHLEGVLQNNSLIIAYSIWKLLGLVILVALIFFLPIHQFHSSTDGLHVLTIVIAIVSVIPASLISVEYLRFGSEHAAFVDAVKLGYPVFWLPLFLGLFSTAAVKEWV